MAEVEERPIVGNAGAGAIGLDGAPKMPRAVPKTPEAIWQQQQNAADKYEAAKLAQFKATDTEYEKGLEPLQKERDAAVKAREAVAPYKDPEKLPGEAPKFTKTEMSQMPQVLLALAAFSGLASRQPLTASLNAMAGLITGIHTGDVEMFDKNFKVYDENFKRAEALNKQALKEYDDIMKHHEWSITEKDRRIQQWEVKYQHKVSAEMREHGLSKAQEWRNAARKNYEVALEHHDRMAEIHQHNQEMKSAREDAQDNKGWKIFQNPDGSLVRVNEITGETGVIENSKGMTKPSAAGGGGNKGNMNALQSTLYEDVATGYYRLEQLKEMAKKTGELPTGSAFLQSQMKNDGLVSAVKNYAINKSIPAEFQMNDALLLGIAFDIASARSGGRGQLSDAKIREVTRQMPLSGDDQETVKTKYKLIVNQLEAANSTLPEKFRYDIATKGQKGDVAAHGGADKGVEYEGHHFPNQAAADAYKNALDAYKAKGEK